MDSHGTNTERGDYFVAVDNRLFGEILGQAVLFFQYSR